MVVDAHLNSSISLLTPIPHIQRRQRTQQHYRNVLTHLRNTPTTTNTTTTRAKVHTPVMRLKQDAYNLLKTPEMSGMQTFHHVVPI